MASTTSRPARTVLRGHPFFPGTSLPFLGCESDDPSILLCLWQLVMLNSASSSKDKWVSLSWSSTSISFSNKLLYLPLLFIPLNSSRCPFWAIGLIKKRKPSKSKELGKRLCAFENPVIYLLKKIYATKTHKTSYCLCSWEDNTN